MARLPRPLPAAPNLDHLKGQARALLREVQAGHPDALARLTARAPGLARRTGDFRLADALWVLAGEYGFPSWPKLRAFVQMLDSSVEGTARGRYVMTLAAVLTAQAGEPAALGRRFAALPLRDLLAVRDELRRRGGLEVVVVGLIMGLGSLRAPVRFDCAVALDHFADGRCVLPLRRLLSDPAPRVRRAALHALTCDACKVAPLPGTPELAATLLELARHDPSVRVRRSAVPLLEACAARPEVRAVLRELATDPDAAVAREAQRVGRRQGLEAV